MQRDFFFLWICIKDELKCNLQRFLVSQSRSERREGNNTERGKNITISQLERNAKKKKHEGQIRRQKKVTLEYVNNNRRLHSSASFT